VLPPSVDTPRFALVTGSVALGGSTTFLINFAGELMRREIPVAVWNFELESPLAGDFARQKIPVTLLDQHHLIFEDRLEMILRQMAEFRPTVVISTLGAVSFEALRYVPDGVFRVGLGQSDDSIVYDMMRHYGPWMDCVAMVSRAMKEKAEAMPEFARNRVAYLPYGVPMDAPMPVREPGQPLRILYLGRLGREQKRVHLFPEILSRLVQSGIPFHWTIAGEGPERAFLEANLKSAIPEQTISFAGAVAYAAVPELIARHDIFLLASDYEGLPLSLLESMGRGLVPVVSDLKSGIPQVVDASNGILVPVNDVRGYAEAIIRLHRQRDEFARKSVAARARVERDFSVAAMADRWLAVLPPQAATASPWPTRFRIKGPLTAKNQLYFSPPVRQLRRLAMKLK
jgi:glycosyltransferase involved in cell wall biosynthesis